MGFITKVEQLYVSQYNQTNQKHFLFIMLKSRTSTYKDHKIFTAQKLNVIGSNTHIRGIQVEIIEDVLLFRSNDLYCHGVLHLKQQGLDTYLIEKDNRVKPTFSIKFIHHTHNIIVLK